MLWALQRFGWFTNYSTSGVITAQQIVILGYAFDTPVEQVPADAGDRRRAWRSRAKNMVRSETGRAWMAVRDMDVAAAVIGIRMMQTKLLAFAISSFYCGVAGALYAFAYLGTVEPEAFNLDLSFRILFMVIIGGVGRILGSFLGAAFITLLPIFLNTLARLRSRTLLGVEISHAALMSNLELIIFGGADHLLPDRRAARPRAAVADRARRSCGCGRSRIDGAAQTAILGACVQTSDARGGGDP